MWGPMVLGILADALSKWRRALARATSGLVPCDTALELVLNDSITLPL